MKKILLPLLVVISFQISAKTYKQPNPYQQYFDKAYNQYPSIPKGMLEAVSHTMTHFKHIDINEPESCSGLPRVYGVMGLTLDGKNYFRNNLISVSKISGYTTNDIISNPEKNILAYAKAFNQLCQNNNLKSNKPEDYVNILTELSELPLTGLQNNFALNSHLYSVLSFMNDADNQLLYKMPAYKVDFIKVFGAANYQILSSSKITLNNSGVFSNLGKAFSPVNGNVLSPDYPPGIWDPAPSCNFSSRSGTPVSAVVIHTVQGSYAGAISWAKNCNSNVSYHYVIRSSDGQVTQMVYEKDKGWHVGSENPYTIGYEHEGYISDPSWYTNAMYNSSADLTRDVCNSGYGINPLRTYFGPGCSGGSSSCLQGSCVKIKGHQMYPNQSHTDPGPNWNWEKYYKLINNNPTVTTLTSSTGTHYDTGGASGNYSDDERKVWLINIPGATTITLTFTSFNLENNYDYLFIYDGNSVNAPLIGKYTGTNSPGTVTSSGGTLTIEFRSDCATTAAGWTANWTSNAVPPPPSDNTPPTTTINAPSNWITQSFTTTFTDADNTGGSGVEKSYYQVIDYNGTEWRANASKGFFSDNFDNAIHPDWTISTGSWAITNNVLVQSDEVDANTNIYAALTQNLSNRYLYHWSGKIEGTGTNRRAGFHYFCSDGSLPNRGNSYFVWFRVDNAKLQFYKVVNDTFNLVKESAYTYTAGQWHDFKVIYDRITGKTDVYIDNAFADSWTDTSPYSSGNHISFRSGNAKWSVNNLKIYRSRAASVTVNVGTGTNADIRYQNMNPTTPSGRIKSIVVDSAKNLSAISSQDVNVDWTAPATISTINDGNGNDIDTTFVNTELSANWTLSADTNSDIAAYWYTIGTTPGDSNVVNWKNNWINTSVTDTGLNLTYGQLYYFSVKAENGAGLFSQKTTSDGILVTQPLPPPTAAFTNSTTTVCDGTTINFYNNSVDATNYVWSFQNGNPATSTQTNPSVMYTTSGTYTVTLIAYSTGNTSDTTTQTINVNVVQPPASSFGANDTVVYLPSATVYFNNTSLNATSYSWDFGDGNISTNPNPVYTYSATGIYTVILTAKNNNCPDNVLIKPNYIEVKDSAMAPAPVASFTNSSTTVCQGDAILFANTSTNAASYQWTFTGGTPSSSTQQNPSVVYNTSGNYSVKLIVTGSGGIDSVTQTINVVVNISPVASFTLSDTLIHLPNAVLFANNASQNANSYTWLWGDGNSSNDLSPWHQYADSGYYTVTLIAANNPCIPDTFTAVVHVAGPLTVTEQTSNMSVNLYPNPASDVFYLEYYLNTGKEVQISIYDIAGKLIYSSKNIKAGKGENKLILSRSDLHLNSGTYLLKMDAGVESNLVKIIIL